MVNAKWKVLLFFSRKIPWSCSLKTASEVFAWIHVSVSGNCAHFHKGGWWYNACGQSNLNGVWYTGGVYRSKFQDGIFWADYGGGFYSMKSVRMLIRPIDWGEPVHQVGPGSPSEAVTNLKLILYCDCTCHKQLVIHKGTNGDHQPPVVTWSASFTTWTLQSLLSSYNRYTSRGI